MNLFGRLAKQFIDGENYLPIATPTTDLHVLDVVTGRSGSLDRYGSLDRVLTAGVGQQLPTVDKDAKVIIPSESMTKSTKVGLGLSIVSTIARALGVTAELKLSSTSVRTIQYSYDDVTADSVKLVDLDKWLVTADFDPTARTTAELLIAERCHVVVAVLKAKSLNVNLFDEQDKAVSLGASAAESKANASTEVTSNASGTLTFHGKSRLAIAAKVITINVDENGFRMSNRPLGNGRIRSLSGSDYAEYTYLDGPELRFEME
jgi:hypothetical protein